jgi:hypothetical protein
MGNDTCDVAVELFFPLPGNEIGPAFDGKDHVHVELGEGVGHVGNVSLLRSFVGI